MGNEWFERFKEQKTAILGLALILIFTLTGIFAEYIAPHDPYAVDLSQKLLPPGGGYLMGTDQLGRCIFSRLIFGVRTSLATAVAATVLMVIIGLPLGILAGYMGGITGNLIMRLADIASSFPSSLLALAIVGVLGPSLVNMVVVFVVLWWAPFARIVRASVVKLRESAFVMAAESAGSSRAAIVFKHILLNSISPIIVLATLRIAAVIMHIAGFSFIGLGSQPPAADWGVMLNDSRPYLTSYPLMMLWPGIAIVISVLAFNLVGEGLNDALLPTSGSSAVVKEETEHG
ncbi:MAG: ABC transporter permease subunit [Spirochaetaceae bacterium]|jgi:peptide/nickel transport system permease protein|nr:ABC transporter permease subunit [Spirochaetaceae bacterium]